MHVCVHVCVCVPPCPILPARTSVQGHLSRPCLWPVSLTLMSALVSACVCVFMRVGVSDRQKDTGCEVSLQKWSLLAMRGCRVMKGWMHDRIDEEKRQKEHEYEKKPSLKGRE